jgi:hypothetical protein
VIPTARQLTNSMNSLPHPRESAQAPRNVTSNSLPAAGNAIADHDGQPLVDLTALASRMPRNASILYPNPPPRSGADWPSHRGLLRLLPDGKMFWVGLWPRTVRGQLVYEIRLTPKTEDPKR